MLLRFADCTLDSGILELRRNGAVVALSPRGQRLLAILLERRPNAVSQRELRDALWPQTHVGYTSLAQVVTEVRKAIGDQPGAEGLIRTVPRVGYAFAAEVTDVLEVPPRSGSEEAPVPGPQRTPPADEPARQVAPAPTPARRRRWPTAVLAAVLLTAGAAGAWLVRSRTKEVSPRFTQLTFRRGIVTSARFSRDGHTVVYSALWDGGPPEVFSRRLDGSASVSLGLPPASLLSVSSKGDLAVLVAPPGERGVLWLGTLARVPLSGGPLRPVLENVLDADWSPDGLELAVVRWHEGQFQLEYPIGRVLLRPCSGTKLRVSPRGDRVALLEDASLVLVDGNGGTSRIAIPPAHQRLAWQGDDALLVDAAESDLHRTLVRASTGGGVRQVLALPGTLVVHDVSPDGRVLFHHGFERWSVRARAPGEAEEHDASVYANSQVQGLSADGERILLWDGGQGPPGSALLYPTRGGPAVRLGEGHPLALSADGAWYLLDRSTGAAGDGAGSPVAGQRLVLAPTGAGETRAIPLERLHVTGSFHLSGEAVGINASEPGRHSRSYHVRLDGSLPRPVTAEGEQAIPGPLPGGEVLIRGQDGTLSSRPLAGGEGRRLPFRLPSHDPFLETVTTIEGGRRLVLREGSMPARLSLLDTTTGMLAPWRTLGPQDATGAGHVWTTLFTPDGQGYAYTHGFFLQDLFLVEGLP